MAATLKSRYGDFAHHNKANPLDELLFILCSVKTAASSYHSTYLALKREFPCHHHIAEAPAHYIAKPIEHGGLSNNKSRAIRAIMDRLVEEFGRPTLNPLREWSDEQCEAFLTSLPYVGKKVARCVMMYSLGREVFPVDTHCWRIALRLGWVRPKKVKRRNPPCPPFSKGGASTDSESSPPGPPFSKGGEGTPSLEKRGAGGGLLLGAPPTSPRRPQRQPSLPAPTPKDMDRLQAKIPPELRFSVHVNFVSLGREFCTAFAPRCSECPLRRQCRRVGVSKKK